MNVLSAAVLGVVQGVTEFLPISSSAHLILARAFFGWDAGGLGVAFDVACHVGTLVAVVLFFRADILAMLRVAPRLARPGAGRDRDVRRIQLIIVGTLPVVVVGLLWADWLEASTRTPAIAATALFLGAVLLLFIERLGRHGSGEDALTPAGALLIGTAQATALVPGVSRSGATIAAGMALGLRREVAARFTFLMSIPAILAAAAKETLALRDVPLAGADFLHFGIGMVTSAIVGYLTVKYLVQFLATHRLDVFAWYRVALAAATVAWLVWR